MGKDDLCAALDSIEKGGTKTGIGELVKFRGFIQLTPGEPMKGDSLHSLQLGPRIAEDLVGRIGSFGAGIHLSISPLSLFGPQASIFLWREIFQALKKFAGQASPSFGVEL
jgi:hypothetical protein